MSITFEKPKPKALFKNFVVYFVNQNTFHRFTDDQRSDFMHNVLTWMNGKEDFHDQRCFALNFGFKRPLPFPEIKLSPDPYFHLNVGTHGSKSPSKCSIVVIGGKYLEQVDEVMKMVDKITEDIAWMPSAVFLMAGKPGQDIKFNVSTRHRKSPTMYQVPATRSSVVQSSKTTTLSLSG